MQQISEQHQDTGVTRRKLQDVRDCIALVEAELGRLRAEEHAALMSCPHYDEHGEPTTSRSMTDRGKGWCNVCLRGFTLDGKRVVGPWTDRDDVPTVEEYETELWRRADALERHRSYVTDDLDIDESKHRLDVFRGGNGDWYLSIVPNGARASRQCVRVTTSGSRRPAVPAAVAALWKALGEEPR